ncbi:hypothetical protein [Zavarzinia aquatilis]|uniref:EF-hand domain-containing protein n=1 Tax=Zavarzinia aquatilis TaxID=2211142 RepID=A0A317EIV7_9PROT|nr:hypothetical protein [Zavarzinia aquatilis]PWR25175.1 hypothetical protein DKG74_05285 [Zavarzinia aquatilis]
MTVRTTATLLLLSLAAGGGLAACADDDVPSRRGPPPGMADRRPPPEAPVTTLAGRPLSDGGQADCPALLGAWLSTADADRDGSLSLAEALADADRLLAEIDTNRDGFATPIEIEAWRERVAPDAYADRRLKRQPGGSQDDAAPTGGKHRGGSPEDEGGRAAGRLDSGLRGQPDPIMAADTGLDFRVDKGELEARVKSRFDRLDTDRGGSLSAEELFGFCPSE